MFTWLQRLLKKRRSFALEEELHTRLVHAADEQKRSADDLAADLIAHALDEQKNSVERWQALSMREQQIAALVCLGYTNRQIASKLNLSPETIKSHIRNLLVKFNLHSKDELRLTLHSWDFTHWDA